MRSTEKCIRCRYVVLDLMFKFALGQIKIGRIAPEKFRNGFLCAVAFRVRGTLGPQRLCQYYALEIS